MNEYLKTKFLEKNRAFKLDDYLFEFQARKIFVEAFGLREKILYPFFSVEYSRNKRANTIKIYYYRLEIEERDKKINCFYFPIITDTFIVYYEEIPIIIEKKSSDDFLMSVISKDFNHSKDFHMLKQGNCFRTSIIYADIQDELFKSEEVVKEAKNKIDSLSNIDIRKEIINTNKENVKKKGIKKKKK